MTATQTFRDKYMALPGDMRNATAFWGFAGGTTGNDSACMTISSTDQKTCNGNGDGWIDSTTALQYSERFRAWQQLANAGLIEGRYTGLHSGTDTWAWIAGENIPAARLQDAAFQFADLNWAPDGSDLFFASTPQGHYLITVSRSYLNNGGVFKPEEAWNIDTKLDDGKPGAGKVMSPNATTNPNCASSDNATSATYVLTTTTKTCSLIMGY